MKSVVHVGKQLKAVCKFTANGRNNIHLGSLLINQYKTMDEYDE